MMRPLAIAALALLLQLASPAPAAARRAGGARLVVLNVGQRAAPFVRRVQRALARYLSARAAAPATAALLAGEPARARAPARPPTSRPSSQPSSAPSSLSARAPRAASRPASRPASQPSHASSQLAVPSEVARLVARVRGAHGISGELLFELGRALGADYLLLLKPSRAGATAVAARLYSVHRLRFAPQGYDGPRDAAALAHYVLSEVRGTPKKRPWYKKWWVWAAGAAVAALTATVVILANRDTNQLRIRVTRAP